MMVDVEQVWGEMGTLLGLTVVTYAVLGHDGSLVVLMSQLNQDIDLFVNGFFAGTFLNEK